MVNAENVIKNWTESSGNYSKLIERELASFKRQAWTELILANAGKSGKLKILDVGTGPGFFTIIMSMAGNDVTAIDCTQAMLDEAQNNAKRNGVSPRFLLSDTQETPFDDESFDLIISRNVAWTILDAEKAYAEWRRILRPDGRVLIFDANWNRDLERLREFPKAKCILSLDSKTDIFLAKKVLGDHMCIMGDVPPALLSLGTPGEVTAYCKRLINEVGPGGFILSSGCDVPFDAKYENVKAMVESVQ